MGTNKNNTTWKCPISDLTYPFYIIKHNLGVIPINNEEDLNNRLKREGCAVNETHITNQEEFSIYIPSGPRILKSENCLKTPAKPPSKRKTASKKSIITKISNRNSHNKSLTTEQINRLNSFDVKKFEQWRNKHVLKKM